MLRFGVGLIIFIFASGAFAQSAPACRNIFSAEPMKALFLDDELDVASARLHFIQNETKSIDAAYYQLDGNKVGGVAFAELIAAAKRGTKVRLLLDSWNPEDWIDTRVKPRMYKALLDAGVEVRIFNPVDPSKIKTYFNKGNFTRMHDKLLILGEQGVVTEGDRNIQNSNFRIQKRKGMKDLSYRSVEVIIKDRAMTEQSQTYFNEMWKLGETPDVSTVTKEEMQRLDKHMESFLRIIRGTEMTKINWESRMKEVQSIDFLRDVPGAKNQAPGIAEGLLNMLSRAEKSIVIYSPYLYLTPRFFQTIQAALNRGVEVKVVLPSWTSIDTPFTMQHFEKQAGQLKSMGVKVLQHEGEDFMHAKMAIVDAEAVFVGSYNFNFRSERTDYETGFVVRDKNFAKDVVEFDRQFEATESMPFSPSKKSMMTSLKISMLRFLVKYVPLVRDQI